MLCTGADEVLGSGTGGASHTRAVFHIVEFRKRGYGELRLICRGFASELIHIYFNVAISAVALF